MKIKSITIEGFKGISFQKVDFTSGKVAAVLGSNGKGKSSFIEALQWALTGNLPQNPIRDGFSESTVEIVLEDGTEFSRTIYRDDRSAKITVDGKTTPAKNLNAVIEENFGFGTDVLKIATSADVLASMKSDEFGDFLLRYVPEKLDIVKLMSFISSPTEEVQKAVLEMFPEDEFEIKDISDAYENFVETRKLAKKDLDYTRKQMMRLSESAPARNIAMIQEDLDNILRKEGAVKGYRDAMRLYEDARRRRESAIKNMGLLQAKFDAITATVPDPSLKENAERNLADAQNNEKEIRKTINIMSSTVATLKTTLDRLATNHCPLSDSLVCTTDKTKVRGEILEVMRSNEDGIKLYEKKLEEILSSISSLSSFLNSYNSNALSYKEKMFIGDEIEKAKKCIPELPTPPSPIKEENFGKEKEILKAEMKIAQEWEERKKLEEREKEEADRVILYEYLCDIFAPKGEIMTKILASYLSIFEEEINKRASALNTGICVKFVPKNGVKYFVKAKEDREFHLYDDLSKGEKTLAVFLLLDLVSALCGTRIMILDDLNNLDKENLDSLFRFVTKEEFLSAYDNVILSSVDNEDILSVVDEHRVAIQKI